MRYRISYTISRLRCRSFFLDVDVKPTTSAYDMEVAPKRPFLVTPISKFRPSISKKKLRYRYTILEDAPKRPFLVTSISKFFLRYRGQNCDIVIRYRRSTSGYTDVEGKFLRCLMRHRIQHRDIRMSKHGLSDVARDIA